MNVARFALTAIFSLGSTALYAQSVAPAAPAAPQATIQQRKGDQQQRIGQGVRSGQLTAGETHHLEHRERAINHEEHNMRARNNGQLTKHDRHTIRRQQNRESHRIYRDKHNARVR